VSGLADGRAAIVIKVHHAIADGIGLVLMLAAFTDLEPNPQRPLDPPGNVIDFRVERPVYSPWQRRWFKTKRCTQAFVASPRRHIASSLAVASSAMRLIWPSRTPLSPVMTGRSGRFCLDTRTVAFHDFKGAGRELGGSLNDTFVTAVVDAIDRYHFELGKREGSRTRLARLRVHMPVDVRAGRTATVAGNQFVPARVTIDVPHGRPAHRVSSVRVQLARLQDEPALTHINTVGALVLKFGKRTAQWVLGGMMQGVDVLASNVPGPNFPLYVAGAKIEQFHAFGPPAGAAINVTLFSYDGKVNLGITTDEAAVTDRALFLRCIDEALASIVESQSTLAASA
jgi:WS/DGAT/MGAT family acyltransferase